MTEGAGIHISLKAEKIFTLAGIPITNSILATWAVMVLLTIVSLIISGRMKMVPGKLQSIAEMLVSGVYGLFESVTGEKTRKFFPIIGTLFFFIIFLNWFGLLPGVGTVGIYETEEPEVTLEEHTAIEQPITENAKDTLVHPEEEAPVLLDQVDSHNKEGSKGTAVSIPAEEVVSEESAKKVFVPILRAGSADINTTLAFAIVAVLVIQYFGVTTLGKEYIGRFFNFKDPIYFAVGLLELLGEGTKIISFAFRLFGNIFAGEVLLAVIAFLMVPFVKFVLPIFVPLPFIGLEIFVGFIQALVFSILTTVFLALATSHQEH